jgi:hypothetical protein
LGGTAHSRGYIENPPMLAIFKDRGKDPVSFVKVGIVLYAGDAI